MFKLSKRLGVEEEKEDAMMAGQGPPEKRKKESDGRPMQANVGGAGRMQIDGSRSLGLSFFKLLNLLIYTVIPILNTFNRLLVINHLNRGPYQSDCIDTFSHLALSGG